MTKDLTTGKIMPILIRFTIPLVLGNLFQLTYNAVDSIIVGHFVGKEALAAVGICNPISTLMILFLNGLCMGASILMGMQYGAKDYDTLHRQISTTMLSGVIFSLILSTACILFARPILILMQADAGILSLTTEYLQIIFLGLVFTFLYNFFSSTLRALGDSNTPLYFLMISAVLNILGDLFFVVVLKAGSNGCAVSTVLSEALCCVFCVIYIQKKVPLLRLGKKWLVFDRSLLMRTIAYGWTSALQQATVQLGKLGIQAIVNTMGVSVAAAFAIVNRIDDFAYTPEQNIAHAICFRILGQRPANTLSLRSIRRPPCFPNGFTTRHRCAIVWEERKPGAWDVTPNALAIVMRHLYIRENGVALADSGWSATSVPSVKSMPCPTHGCGWMPKPCAPNAKLSGWTKNVRSRPNWFHTAILTDGNMTRGSALSAVRRRNDKERKDG